MTIAGYFLSVRTVVILRRVNFTCVNLVKQCIHAMGQKATRRVTHVSASITILLKSNQCREIITLNVVQTMALFTVTLCPYSSSICISDKGKTCSKLTAAVSIY